MIHGKFLCSSHSHIWLARRYALRVRCQRALYPARVPVRRRWRAVRWQSSHRPVRVRVGQPGVGHTCRALRVMGVTSEGVGVSESGSETVGPLPVGVAQVHVGVPDQWGGDLADGGLVSVWFVEGLDYLGGVHAGVEVVAYGVAEVEDVGVSHAVDARPCLAGVVV